MHTETLSLLSHLWLHEPDAATLARAHDTLDLPGEVGTAELASAYADLFLLNVYPYGTAYTDAWGEVNTLEARRTAAAFETYGYQPQELLETGAPDHLGLCLGFLSYLLSLETSTAHVQFDSMLQQLRAWAPVCCLAAEREPGVHAFYRTLAERTRAELLNAMSASDAPPGARHSPLATQREQLQLQANPADEFRLKDVVRLFLFPARCGMFLSRGRLGRLARPLGLRLPFGSRFEVAEWLFAGAGEGGQILPLLEALDDEAAEWGKTYLAWVAEWPQWQAQGVIWLNRIRRTRDVIAQMQQQARSGAEISFALPTDTEIGLPGR